MKKFLAVIIMSMALIMMSGCADKESDLGFLMDNWCGIYICENEETQEFKILEITLSDEETIDVVCRSVRDTENFSASPKSQSGKYVAVNLGSKTLKMNLGANNAHIEIDDMWTEKSFEDRNENWSGKYIKLKENEKVPSFGNMAWNGKYFCEENGKVVSVYGIKERYVLFTYKLSNDAKAEDINLLCLESDPKRAVYTKDERLVMIDLIRDNEKITIRDMYMNDVDNKGISGSYVKYVKEDKNER